MRRFFYHTARRAAAAVGVFAVALFAAIGYYSQALPDRFYVPEGKELTLSGFSLIQGKDPAGYNKTSLANMPAGAGKTVELRLLGAIPLKTAHVSVVDRPVVTPGGTPFGIKLFTEGVMVVDIGNIETAAGARCPAKSAGIEVGDVILTIGGNRVSSNEQIAAAIEASGGGPLAVTYHRDGSEMSTTLVPLVSNADGKYKSGVWVRDSSAGIGTITYYNPQNGDFGGLGHGICDVDTGQIMPLNSGEVCDVKINGILKGRAGSPGELRGSFVSSIPCGSLRINSEAGIFGRLEKAPNRLSNVPIKLKQEVHTGPATILCTLDDSGIHEYSIQIEKVDLNPVLLTKNMMITVTDPVLLEKTGGIVQGMSGSPILQDGQLIGAVTHVFVNNPTKGYGIFSENMLNYQ